MASRSKKKKQIKSEEIVENKSAIVEKSSFNILGTIFIVLCICVFIFLFFTPIITIKINYDTGYEEYGTISFKANGSIYRIMFAPARGVTNIMEYVFDDSGFLEEGLISSGAVDIDYSNISNEKFNSSNNFGVMIFVLSYVMLGLFLVFLILQVIDNKKKLKGVLSLIGLIVFSLSYFITFFIAFFALIGTMSSSFEMMPGWGGWLLLILVIASIVIKAYIVVKNKKEAKEHEVH